jgi:hypothetical protein
MPFVVDKIRIHDTLKSILKKGAVNETIIAIYIIFG